MLFVFLLPLMLVNKDYHYRAGSCPEDYSHSSFVAQKT